MALTFNRGYPAICGADLREHLSTVNDVQNLNVTPIESLKSIDWLRFVLTHVGP